MRIALGQIHRAPAPAFRARVRGMGQDGCFAGGFAQNMQEWIQGISDPGINSQTDAAVGCGTGGNTPCASPQDAANQALAIAASWCQEANNQSWMGCPTDPNCGDGGVAAAAPYVAQALAIFSGFPASVWTAEAANAASGNYYGPQPAGPCPAGTFTTVANGVVTCSAPSTAPSQYTGDSGPKVNILTGQPIASTITPASAPVNPTPASTAPAAGTSTPAAGSSNSSTSSSTSATTDPFAWLTQTSIGTLPNWMLLAGGLAALMVLPSLLKGGR
jgi:hypothetical protein